MPVKPPLSPHCVYTIRSSRELNERVAAGGFGDFREGKRWVNASTRFVDARKRGQAVLVFFGPAEGDIAEGIGFVAHLDAVRLDKTGTRVRYSNLTRLSRRLPLNHLRKVSDDEPLSRHFKRPYSLCQTPVSIMRTGLAPWRSTKSKPVGASRAYILKWNPKKFEWEGMPDDVSSLASSGQLSGYWKCGVTKRILPGDRLFLLRVGVEPCGIVGSGRALGKPCWRRDFQNRERKGLYVEVDFDALLDPSVTPVLNFERLMQRDLVGAPWKVQGSGKGIPGPVLRRLEQVWRSHLATLKRPEDWSPVALRDPFLEGVAARVSTNRFERNRGARQACIQHHGCRCAVCDFSFAAAYGEAGAGFIEVHHIKPVAVRRKQYAVDPVRDLIPVCPNCHAMIHRRARPLSIEAIRSLVKRHRR